MNTHLSSTPEFIIFKYWIKYCPTVSLDFLIENVVIYIFKFIQLTALQLQVICYLLKVFKKSLAYLKQIA